MVLVLVGLEVVVAHFHGGMGHLLVKEVEVLVVVLALALALELEV